MRVFVTGASGWIGSATVAELVGAGHQVVGLARSDAVGRRRCRRAGATAQRGDLDDLEVLRSAAADSDGVIHLAFKHEIAFTGDFAGAAEADRARHRDVRRGAGRDGPAAGHRVRHPGPGAGARGDRAGRPRPAAGRLAAAPGPARRLANAELTLSFADRGIRSCVVRLAPTNHGDGDNGFMATLVAIARAKGVAGFTGDGSARWPAVHRLDTGRLFRLAVEQAPAGSTLHAVADEGVPTREIAEAIGRGLDLPVAAIPDDAAAEHFGFLVGFIGLDSPASSALTRELMGWEPAQVGLIEDLDQGHYFDR